MPVLEKFFDELVVEGKRLGRHFKFDPLAHSISELVDVRKSLKSQAWERMCPPFNQGQVGSCTGNAMAGLLMTEPFYVSGRDLTETDAVKIYSLATHIDPVNGESYPPNDTGSSGIDVMKASKELGYVEGYHAAFSPRHVASYLSHVGPGIFGVPWMDTFDSPDENYYCRLTPASQVRGGHELEMDAIEVDSEGNPVCVWFWNSWSDQWGDGGKARFDWQTFEALFQAMGDFVAAVTAEVG